MSNLSLRLLVFVSGFAMLGVELAGSRLLAPFFGSSLLVWANLIGMILFAIALGNYAGGRLADIRPDPSLLWMIFASGGFFTALLPFIGRPILALAIPALAHFDAISGGASFVGVLLLFVVPMTCFGMTSPFAIRLAMIEKATSGSKAGSLYAISTGGSILGVYLTVFALIPMIGTQATFALIGLTVVGMAIVGLVLLREFRSAILLLGFFSLVGILALRMDYTIRDREGLIKEIESPYNFIQVYDRQGVRSVAVNEGLAEQSVYRPDGHLSGGIWDLFLLAPQFTATPKQPDSLLIIGLAAGTVAKEYSRVYGDIVIDGVEIDPAMVDVGREYMKMDEPNLRVSVSDGRTFLAQSQKRYDVIVLDAYHQPYIPFHLATTEFFDLVRDHLTPNGVVALNAARTESDFRLVNSLSATLGQVFPTVIALDHPVDANTLLIAPNQRFSLVRFGFSPTGNGELDALARRLRPRLTSEPGIILTDDRAPIENLIHAIILDFATHR